MQGEIYSVYFLAIEPSNFPKFQSLIAKVVAATSKEQDTLAYEYAVSDDQSRVHIIERYRTAGLVPHVEQTFAPFAEEFLSLVTIEKLFVYGETTPEIRAKLDGFGPVYMRSFDGFSR